MLLFTVTVKKLSQFGLLQTCMERSLVGVEGESSLLTEEKEGVRISKVERSINGSIDDGISDS